MKLAPTMIVARIMFYFGVLALVASAMSLSFPDWQKFGLTGGLLLKLTDTFMLISIALMVGGIAEKRS